ncbi:MAG: glycerophosphodiester phosphodiesterase family protein [Pseudomonadota bacterium]
MTLPAGFFDRPFAHRALHGPGRPENSREAILAAVEAGFGIEVDVQRTADGQAVVFHDYGLKRLTGTDGTVQTTDADALARIPLLGGPTGAPPLDEVLTLVAGRVPLVIEIKDQDGAMGPNVGALEAEVAQAIAGYTGPLAVMSFNPHSVARMAELAPDVPRGIVTCAFTLKSWPVVPTPRRLELAGIPDFDRVGACFISHDHRSLGSSKAVARLKAQGVPVLCWTIRSEDEARAARQVADQITFEGYMPA